MLNDHFVKQTIREVEIENYIKDGFPSGDYSDINLQRTPLGLKIIIFTNKPGRIIGKRGKNIDMINEALRHQFNLDNVQIDIKAIKNPDLDPKIVSKQITSALERGYNYKKMGNIFLKKIMDAGAIGVQIIIKGSLGGDMSRMGKFTTGYLKHCGFPAQELVDQGFYTAQTKRGVIGVTVKIMKEFQDITGAKKTKAQMEEEKLKKILDELGDPDEQPETNEEKPKKASVKKPKKETKAVTKKPKSIKKKEEPKSEKSEPKVDSEEKPKETKPEDTEKENQKTKEKPSE